MKAIKQKTCKVCRFLFTPFLTTARVCSPICAQAFAVSVRGKAEKVAQIKDRRETKEKLIKFKSRATWAREAQTEINAFIRLRDAHLPCISCGRHHTGQYHAGHYLSVGARPELRFTEMNIHKQCAPCNTHLSGNAVLYRKALIEKIGLSGVEMLEGPIESRKLSIDDFKDIKQKYVEKTKTLKDAQA